jgi:hypothetical protein
MSKSTNYTGLPILNQLLFFMQGVNIRKIAKQYDAERYVKKFDARQLLVAVLFGVMGQENKNECLDDKKEEREVVF